MCLIGFIVTQRRAHDGKSVNKTYSLCSRVPESQRLENPSDILQQGDIHTSACSAQSSVGSRLSHSLTLTLWIWSAAHFVAKKNHNALTRFSRMHPATEEKIELGFGEQGKVNPAFVVSVTWNRLLSSTTVLCESNFGILYMWGM